MTHWGIVATILAPTLDVLRFAAYHLDAGAHRLFIYLDDPETNAYASLKAHPKIRVHQCNDAHWKKLGGRRPVKHQVRQSQNATHAYNRKTDVDWLIHIDVDEFIVSQADIGTTLYKLDEQTLCARLRLIEQLVGDGQTFRGFIPNGPSRNAIITDIYPKFEKYIKGGFLGHVASNVFQREVTNPQQVKLPTVDLAIPIPNLGNTVWNHLDTALTTDPTALNFRLQKRTVCRSMPFSLYSRPRTGKLG